MSLVIQQVKLACPGAGQVGSKSSGTVRINLAQLKISTQSSTRLRITKWPSLDFSYGTYTNVAHASRDSSFLLLPILVLPIRVLLILDLLRPVHVLAQTIHEQEGGLSYRYLSATKGDFQQNSAFGVFESFECRIRIFQNKFLFFVRELRESILRRKNAEARRSAIERGHFFRRQRTTTTSIKFKMKK